MAITPQYREALSLLREKFTKGHIKITVEYTDYINNGQGKMVILNVEGYKFMKFTSLHRLLQFISSID